MKNRIKFEKNEKQLELIRAMASSNRAQRELAQDAFAALISPILGRIFRVQDTTQQFYRDMPYNPGENPTYTTDLFAGNTDENYFAVWSQGMPGGLATNEFFLPNQEVKFTTYRLDSAWSILEKFARESSLNTISAALQRIMDIVLLKTNHMAWSVLLAALAQANHSYLGVSTGHVFQSITPGKFTLDDQSSLLTRFRRLNASWAGGSTPNTGGKPSDLYVSPFTMQSLRAMSYNPVNTKGANQIDAAADSGVVTLPESQRASLWASSGCPEFYGLHVNEMLELDKGAAYSLLFETYIGSTNLPYVNTLAASGQTFSSAADELIIVIDGSQDLGIRAIEQNGEDVNSVFTLNPDDQFLRRQEKLGWYGGIREGRSVANTFGLAALVV